MPTSPSSSAGFQLSHPPTAYTAGQASDLAATVQRQLRLAPPGPPRATQGTLPALASSSSGRSEALDKFDEFFGMREDEKNQLYRRVVFLGWSAVAVGVSTGVLGLILWYIKATPGNTPGLYFTGAALAVLGTLIFSTGVCLLSTVPTDAFNIDKQLESRPTLNAWITTSFGITTLFVGLVLTTFFPYVTGVPLVLMGLWTLLGAAACCVRRVPLLVTPLTTKISLFALLLFIPLSALYFVIGNDPFYITKNFVVPGIWTEWAAELKANRAIIQPLQTSVGALYLLTAVIFAVIWWRMSRAKTKREGWRTKVFYISLYHWMISTGINCLIINATARLTNDFVIRDAQIPNLCVVVMVLAPTAITAILGPDRVFMLLARYYEYNPKRLQKDGSLMAELAASSQVYDTTTMSRWVYRKTRALHKASTDASRNNINREFWMRGSIVRLPSRFRAATSQTADGTPALSPTGSGGKGPFGLRASASDASTDADASPRDSLLPSGTSLSPSVQSDMTLHSEDHVLVRVTMAEDENSSWTASYQGPELQLPHGGSVSSRVLPGQYLSQPLEGGAAAAGQPSPAFSAWVAANFKDEQVVQVDAVSNSVMLRVPAGNNMTDRHDLLKWALENMRKFCWEKFQNDLLLVSPRELGDNAAKAKLFELSLRHDMQAKKAKKIDFFISHSWDDNPQAKCDAMERFMATFAAKHKRQPTMWLDKVCIDQANPGNALAVLSINIGACSQMLVLMSRTYLRRLWCVWELFTLFTFCYKELAVQRVVVVPIQGSEDDAEFDLVSELRNFSIDNAHCFDPNEEYKLRQIMHDIGIERLKTSLTLLADSLERGRDPAKALASHRRSRGASAAIDHTISPARSVRVATVPAVSLSPAAASSAEMPAGAHAV